MRRGSGGYRRGAAFLIAATILASLLPPSHIHPDGDRDDHDHAAAIEHSHWASHGPSRAGLDDDDGRAIFVDRPALVRDGHAALRYPVAAIVAVLVAIEPLVAARRSQRLAGNAPRDGPSFHDDTLRGPPLVL